MVPAEPEWFRLNRKVLFPADFTLANRNVNRNGASEFCVLSRDVGLGPGVARAGVTTFHLLALSVSLTVAPSLSVSPSLSLSLSL